MTMYETSAVTATAGRNARWATRSIGQNRTAIGNRKLDLKVPSEVSSGGLLPAAGPPGNRPVPVRVIAHRSIEKAGPMTTRVSFARRAFANRSIRTLAIFLVALLPLTLGAQ